MPPTPITPPFPDAWTDSENLSYLSYSLRGMHITTLTTPKSEIDESEIDTALGILEDVGVGFIPVCSGPEPFCPAWQIPQAA